MVKPKDTMVRSQWLGINPSQLRFQIQIQQNVLTPFPAPGQPAQTWTTVRSCYAAISTASSREWFQANQFSDDATHLVVVRWSPVPLAAGMRVLFGSRVFTVQNVENVQERNVKMNLICIEVDGVSS
jgi:SPP1 family predicted phage head-tail adaptor